MNYLTSTLKQKVLTEILGWTCLPDDNIHNPSDYNKCPIDVNYLIKELIPILEKEGFFVCIMRGHSQNEGDEIEWFCSFNGDEPGKYALSVDKELDRAIMLSALKIKGII